MAGKLLTQAQAVLDAASRTFDVSDELIATLRAPATSLMVAVPLVRTDGRLEIFQAHRVRYNDLLGPTKGGLRYHPAVSLDEVETLAFWMTIKCSLLGLPFGGGKGGISVDVTELTEPEVERLTRTFTRALGDAIGPDRDIPAPDVYTNARTMAWIADEYGRARGRVVPAVVTGKPIEAGGIPGRESATAAGGVIVLETLRERLLSDVRQPTVAVHGFGNAGAIAATLLSDKGYLVVAVADSRDAIFDPRGLDVARLREVKERTGRLGRPTGARVLSPSELLELEVDVLVPASLEGVIADVNAAQVSARVILELANGPVTPSAEARLTQRGTVVIPDVLANAGGVTVSYFEWVSGRTGEQWTRARVDAGLIEGMSAAADEVFEAASDRGVTMRTAAFGLAIQRLDRALGHQTSFDDDARDLALASA